MGISKLFEEMEYGDVSTPIKIDSRYSKKCSENEMYFAIFVELFKQNNHNENYLEQAFEAYENNVNFYRQKLQQRFEKKD